MGFAILERWLKRNAAEPYLAAIADLCRATAGAPGLVATTTYLSDDPSAALNVAEWQRLTDHLLAQQRVPEAIALAPRAFAAPGGDRGWVWFEQRYMVRDMGAPVGLCAATRFALTPEQARGYLAWASESARAALRDGHLSGIVLLERPDAPGQFLALEEYPDPGARAIHLARQRREHRPGGVDEVRTFRGATAYHWSPSPDGLSR